MYLGAREQKPARRLPVANSTVKFWVCVRAVTPDLAADPRHNSGFFDLQVTGNLCRNREKFGRVA
jgi:hypothetical protein